MSQVDTVVVARLGRPHGLRGEMSIEVRTDDPASRFTPGTVFTTDPPGAGPLTLASARSHRGSYLLGFTEVLDRGTAQALRDTLLLAPARHDDDPDAFYDADLVGLRAILTSGGEVGYVVGVEHGPAHDLLVINQTGAGLARVPFVAALVPDVDPAAGTVTLDPPGGLLAAVPAVDG